uniref:Uncharacterized protein n=1 Tax=Arundo donax TaxID=35708 RepID=A0A0A9A320_ARUDO
MKMYKWSENDMLELKTVNPTEFGG